MKSPPKQRHLVIKHFQYISNDTFYIHSIVSQIVMKMRAKGPAVLQSLVKSKDLLPNRVMAAHKSGTPNDGFLLNTLKTPFRLPRVLLDL